MPMFLGGEMEMPDRSDKLKVIELYEKAKEGKLTKEELLKMFDKGKINFYVCSAVLNKCIFEGIWPSKLMEGGVNEFPNKNSG
jgi:hypothetical protein